MGMYQMRKAHPKRDTQPPQDTCDLSTELLCRRVDEIAFVAATLPKPLLETGFLVSISVLFSASICSNSGVFHDAVRCTRFPGAAGIGRVHS